MKKRKVDICSDDAAVTLFKDLLRYKTVSHHAPKNGQYAACCEFLDQKCKELIPEAKTETLEFVEGKPVLLVTVEGRDPSLPGILLNSHYDVVPAMDELWDVDPWDACEKDGKIYGRGTQDMKCVCAQYILALARIIHDENTQLDRTVYLTFVPDEEIGGGDGMNMFIESKRFKEIRPKIGIAFDEGLASTTEQFTVFYGERVPLWIVVTVNGPTGHGSRFIQDTAVEKLLGIANKAFELRRAEEKLLGHTDNGCKHCEAKKLGEVTSLNLTMLQAGVSSDGGKTFALNVIPTQAKAGFDIRVPPSKPLPEIRAMLDEWTSENCMSWKFAAPDPGLEHHVTAIDDSNPWWSAFTKASDSIGISIQPEIFPAGTDSRYLRQCGIPAFGFSPMNNSPILLHEHNEYISKQVFLKGIEIYVGLFSRLAAADSV
uniref:N-acyl-aliphatic-L-amino acid amidohydrolase n=2 Tax=Aplanochytrium stocchinoi TaxID=215587 RepID=A0A7S3PP99_9STRA|mmetsp:Transcript_10493/g.11974  ORF Transcript_10493/g.11974 Transcript_10493/m.11974 type:complete len:430 (+) Transcript_10493:111-1400(+)|eukprot:CAMPEP_0204863346 /NCGR_PEP_ID=MMETSP1348-20121228/3245_1 /ASSEMBLY_ACC=CAM_ASM_000700 /TAXON_ID=215587 /ORGANISM="Aplanochytrium stocchinoi, Strain GSBS06" /LENGTH=429 /DNA_ID=CAMNT_0052013649 /DNA_START=12 /DNA_END=1301 /DNA_ORIENTATION=+